MNKRIPSSEWSPCYKFTIAYLRERGILKHYYLARKNHVKKRRLTLEEQETKQKYIFMNSRSIIDSSFSWGETSQGRSYWADLSRATGREWSKYSSSPKTVKNVTGLWA
jgi:hypothetical protein